MSKCNLCRELNFHLDKNFLRRCISERRRITVFEHRQWEEKKKKKKKFTWHFEHVKHSLCQYLSSNSKYSTSATMAFWQRLQRLACLSSKHFTQQGWPSTIEIFDWAEIGCLQVTPRRTKKCFIAFDHVDHLQRKQAEWYDAPAKVIPADVINDPHFVQRLRGKRASWHAEHK